MKFETILKKARSAAAKADISGIDFLAVQINITGENPRVLYYRQNTTPDLRIRRG